MIEQPQQSQGMDDLPEQLPGINLEIGLKNVAGNRILFAKLLREFRQDYLNVVATIRTALNQDRSEEVLRLTHTIKGISGSLGADELHVASRELEDAVKEKQTDVYIARVEQLEQALTPVLQGISTLQTVAKVVTPPPTQQAATTLDIAGIAPLFQALVPMLQAGFSATEEKLEEVMQQHFIGSEHASVLKELQEQVEDYEYGEALDSLLRLAEKLGIILEV